MKMLSNLAAELSELGFPMFAYLPSDSKMYRIEKGGALPMPVPEVIKDGLEDGSKSVIYFRKGKDIIAFFFFRLKTDEGGIVLIIQDGIGGANASSVISSLAKKAMTEKKDTETIYSSFPADESLKREIEKMVGRITDLEISATEKDTKISELQRRLFVQNELLEKYENSGNDAPDRSDEVMELKEKIISKNDEIAELKAEIQSMQIESESLSCKLGTYDDVMSDNDLRLHDLELEMEEKSEGLVKAEELIDILTISRNKIRKLMDGMPMPLFSVDTNFLVKNVNHAAGQFAGDLHLSDIVGKECYRVFYGFDKPCEWCKLNEAVQGQDITEHIDISKNDKKFKYELHMFPLPSKDGEVDEVGEHLFDMTEQYELINSLEQHKGQIKKYKMSKLNDINEIEELKKEYAALNESYEDLQVKFHKMRTAVERLLAEDKMNELLRARKENTELRNKLTRAASALKNYQTNLDESKVRYSDLNKKTVYQLERLINVIKSKVTVKQPEIEQSLAFVGSEISRLKQDYDKLYSGKTVKTSVNVSEHEHSDGDEEFI